MQEEVRRSFWKALRWSCDAAEKLVFEDLGKSCDFARGEKQLLEGFEEEL